MIIIITHRLRKTHQAIERNTVAGEIDTLDGCDTKRMLIQREAGHIDVVGDDVA